MANILALPHRYKTIGLLILVPSIFCWALSSFDIYIFPFLLSEKGGGLLGSHNNYAYTLEIIVTGLVVGLLMIAFAREKKEDEFILTLRLQSLQWAVLANALLLLVANWTLYMGEFLMVMIYNMLAVLIIFVVRFHFILFFKKLPSRTIFSLAPKYKKIGLSIVIPCIIAYFLNDAKIYDFPFLKTGHPQDLLSDENYSFIDEILLTGMTIGLIMMAFARERTEDEFIISMRLRSLQWAVLLNYVLLLIVTWVYLDDNLLQVLIYNMFTVLVIFIIWFNIACWKNNSLTAEQ